MAGRLMAQLEREAAALAVMASLAVVVVHLPVKLAAPQLYPLRFPAGEDCCLCICGLLLTQASMPRYAQVASSADPAFARSTAT